MEIGFGEALLLFGALLIGAAAVSGLLHGTVLSISVGSVAAGIIGAETGLVTIDPGDNVVVHLVELALVLTLFTDGMFAERRLLRAHWSPVARTIGGAMPITLVLLAFGAKLLFGELGWAEAFLLAAVLTPTDPVVTSTVVTSQRVPEKVRHTLNLESGLNDGLALPFVLFFLVLAAPGGNAGSEAAKLLGEALFGGLVGVAVGYAGGKLHDRVPGDGLAPHYEGIFAIGFGLLAFGLADVTIGNGLIAAFVAGITMSATEGELPDSFVGFSESVSAIAQLVTFFVFGGLIVATGYDGDVWRIAIFIALALLVARPVAVWLSLLGEPTPGPQKAFIAWFGPKGVASMLFALYVLNSAASSRGQIFEIASFVILASITAHGLTDTLGTRWVTKRLSDSG